MFADELKAGDKLQKADGSHLTIDQVEFVLLEEPVMVYNFTVADDHTYYVTDLGIWVHNTLCANITWQGFSRGSLKIHWGKPGKEFGKITQNDYLKLAKGFAAETNSSFKEQVVGNFSVKYDPKSSRVLVGHIKSEKLELFTKMMDDQLIPFKLQLYLQKNLVVDN